MKTIHHVLDLDGDAAQVWQALTSQAGLAGWWTDRVDVESTDVDAVVRFVFDGDFNPVMQVVDSLAPQRLVWRCVDGHANWQDNTFTFVIAPLSDGRSRLRFTQDYATELSDDDYGVYNFNWGYYLESLRLLVTSGAGKPFVPGAR